MKLFFIKILPKRFISRFTGLIAGLYLPRFLRPALYRAFARKYGVNLEEIARPLQDYNSFDSFFTRQLKEGVRFIPSDNKTIISPVDARISQFGPINGSTLIQAKGFGYTLKELLGDEAMAENFKNGYFITLYLSPKDYHRIHCAMDGKISGFGYIPGELWPVNDLAVYNIKRLFAVNERVLVYHSLQEKSTDMATIMVGALNVGKITLTFCDLKKEEKWRKGFAFRPLAPFIDTKLGQELGAFHLGSTVILLFREKKFSPAKSLEAGKVELGVELGKIKR